ncbi:hypothetical protein [Mangrovimonas spongiae]|uniref:Uncharacterized protein n=1 Tax=Mangrovimonas spongiae TaxID=2494697 RepID=A0A428JWX0_9FLAO|nr:hypothetical protein [Mangrovimonas spongiae]RSK38672.1 hypothetical protein EJA19_11485 [Mangrovimonas spongiae]
MKKLITITISFILMCSWCFSQDQSTTNLLTVDSLWTKEWFEFPIHFAPNMNYKGYEEAYFPEHWSNQDSPDYWSYVFVWNIDGQLPLGEQQLEHDLQLYFDGLMTVVNKNKDFKVPQSTIVIIQQNKNAFKGKMRLYNAFHTKRMMLLNVMVSSHYCKTQNRTLVLFRFSPSDFNTEIWNKLNRITLQSNSCNAILKK